MNTIIKLCQEQNIAHYKGALLKEYSYFQIGGPADLLVEPTSIEQLRILLAAIKERDLPLYILGNGTNVLFSDLGFRGVVVRLANNFSKYTIEGKAVQAQAGASLSKLLREASSMGLSGAEFATGIPGTVGGGVVMNAGAYGGELKDILKWVRVLTQKGEVVSYSADEMEFTYRNSRVKRDGDVVLEAFFELQEGDVKQIQELVDDLTQKRNSKQPVEMPSAGSTFKRPEGYFAGKLIQDSGCKGLRIGDAMVSEKHSGFVINCGKATSKDVLTLIRVIQQRIRLEFGVEMQTEVRIIGETGEITS